MLMKITKGKKNEFGKTRRKANNNIKVCPYKGNL